MSTMPDNMKHECQYCQNRETPPKQLYLVAVQDWEENFTIGVFDTLTDARFFCLTSEWRTRYDLAIFSATLNEPFEIEGEEKAIMTFPKLTRQQMGME